MSIKFASPSTIQTLINQIKTRLNSKIGSINGKTGESIALTAEDVGALEYSQKWIPKTFAVSEGSIPDFDVRHVWTDGTDVYYSERPNLYFVLNKSTSTWEPINFNNTNIDGQFIWTDGTDIYNTWGETYKFNKSTKQWTEITIDAPSGASIYGGKNIWHDFNGHVFHSFGDDQYELDKTTTPWSWKQKTWDDVTDLYAHVELWNDGNYVYLGIGKRFNPNTLQFENVSITFNTSESGEFSRFSSQAIWHDDDGNTYHHNGCIFNRSAMAFVPMTFIGNASPGEWSTWTDNEGNVYTTESGNHYFLQKSSSDLGTAATKDIPISGNATESQVVMGNDTRLTDSRPIPVDPATTPTENGAIWITTA